MRLCSKSFSILVISLQLFWSPVQAANNEAAYLQKSMQAYQNNDLNGCVKGFFALTKIQPKKGLYWFNLGNCLFMGGLHAKSTIAYEKVVKLQSPLAPAAKLYQARAFIKLGNQDKAREILLGLRNANLPPGLRGEVALECYELGLYAETEAHLQQTPQPLDSKTQLLLGLSQLKQNKNAEAEKTLKGVSGASDLSVADRTSVHDLLASLKGPSTLEKDFGLYLDLAYGTTTNAYLEGRSYAPVSSPLVRTSVGTYYRYFQGPAWSQRVAYFLDYENPTSAPELSTQTHILQLPISYQSKPWDFAMTPYMATQLWNSSMAYQKTGALFRSSMTSASWAGGVDLDVSSQKGSGDSHSYLSGTSYSLRPYASFTQGSWTLQFSWVMGSDGIQDIVYADGSRLPLQHTYMGPGFRAFWRMTTASSFAFQMLRLERSYKNNSLPEDKHRQDQETSASLKYTYGFGRGWVVYGLVEYNPNKSTLGSDDVRDKNYDSTNALAGVGWDVF